MSDEPRAFGLAEALGGIVAMSFSAILVRAAGVEPAVSAMYRCVWALPVLAVMALRSPAPRATWPPALVAGIGLGLDLVLFHDAIDRIGPGRSTVLANTAVLFVLLYTVLVRRRPVGRRLVIAVIIVLAGVVLLRGVGDATPLDTVGLVEGILAGVFYASFLVGYERSMQVAGSLATPLFGATLGAAVTCAATVAILGQDPRTTPTETAYLVVLALSAQVVAWVLIGRGIRRLSALVAAILLLIQPVLTTVWGVLIYDEPVTALQWIGIAVILAGVTYARPARG